MTGESGSEGAASDMTTGESGSEGTASDMTGASGSDRAPGPDAVEDLREQVGRDRRELADTVSALHDKADLKGRVRETATGAESAVAGLLSWAVRTVGALPSLVRRATAAASDRAHRRV